MSRSTSIPTHTLIHNGSKIHWAPLIEAYCKPLEEFLASSFVRPLKTLLPLLTPLVERYRSTGFSLMYEEELKDIGSVLKVDWTLILLLQLAYESFAACTSALIRLPDKGLVHFRTMDWDLPLLKPLTVLLSIKAKGSGEILWEGVGWAGSVGILTGVKQGLASLSVNFRPYESLGFPQSYLKASQRLMEGAWPIGHLCRQVLERSTSYKDLKDCLETAALVAPTYLTICSADDQGARILRSPSSFRTVSLEADEECLVQTNGDFYPGYTDSKNVFASKERCALMKSLSPSSLDDLVSQAMVSPVLSPICLYACVMDPKGSPTIPRAFIP